MSLPENNTASSVCIRVTIQTSVYTAMTSQVALNTVTSLRGQERRMSLTELSA